jgi:hypothetical protein
MGKTNIFTVITVAIVLGIAGYVWYGPHLFGDVMSTGGHKIDFLKTDVTSVVLMILAAFGLTHVLESHVTASGVKDIHGSVKLGLSLGTFMLGLPAIMLLNILGFGTDMLLVVFGYLVVSTILTTIVIVKLKRA